MGSGKSSPSLCSPELTPPAARRIQGDRREGWRRPFLKLERPLSASPSPRKLIFSFMVDRAVCERERLSGLSFLSQGCNFSTIDTGLHNSSWRAAPGTASLASI